MNSTINKALTVISVILFAFVLIKCKCETENYVCPNYSREYSNMLKTISKTNFIFESDSGKRILLKMTESQPEKETSQTCSGTKNNCDCIPCQGSNYFQFQAIDTSEVAQFWHITFQNTIYAVSNFESVNINFETVSFTTNASFPFVAGDNVQILGDLILSGKIYKDVIRVEIKDKNSVNDLAFVMINETHGIIGFKELGSEEIFYRK